MRPSSGYGVCNKPLRLEWLGLTSFARAGFADKATLRVRSSAEENNPPLSVAAEQGGWPSLL